MRVPMRFADRGVAYKNERDKSVISSAIRGSVYRDVPLDQIIATQRTVNADRVKQYASDKPKNPSKHAPVVLEHRGRYYLHNGHHRAVARLQNGKETLRARVATLDGPRKFASSAMAGTLLLIDPRAMAASYTPREEPDVEIVEGGIAVLTIEGPLESKPGGCDWAYYDDYESIMQRFRDALECEDVRGVLLKIDSPGGMAAGLNATVDAMRKLKKKFGKLVCAYSDEKCCSAAYALACVADDIYLPPAGEIGSIGVTSTLVDSTRANKKAGHKVVVITSGKRKADGNPDVPITDEAQAHIQRRVDRLADLYYRLVQKARGLSVEKVKALEADTFDGKDAVSAGLADSVWTLEKTLREMRERLDEEGLDGKPKGMSDTKGAPEKDMAKKSSAKAKAKSAVEEARKSLKRAEAALAAAEKTPPADEDDEEDEEEEGSMESSAESSEEEEEGSSESSSTASSEEDEEDEEEGSSAESAEDEEEKYEDEEEEEKKAASALLSLAQDATGKKGRRAIGALAAMLAEGRSAAKVVKKISLERRSEKKDLAIQTALAHRRITRHEAKDLAGKSSRFVTDFLSMRKSPLVATDEDALKTPSHKSGAELPAHVQSQIDSAVAAAPEDQKIKLRKKLIAAQRDQLASANGAGRF